MPRNNEAEIKEYYRILGVPNGAELALITKSYRELAKKYHPDKIDEFDPEIYYAIQIAYTELKKIKKEIDKKNFQQEEDPILKFTQNFIDENFKVNQFNLRHSFYKAAVNGDLKSIQKVLDYRFNINYDFGQQNTILHFLVFESNFNFKVLKFLFENKININQLNSNGESAFDFLVDKRTNTEAIAFFLNYGANAQNCKKCKSIEIINKYNTNPISFILKKQNEPLQALIAMKNLYFTKEYDVHDKEITRTIKCLEKLSLKSADLDSLCGVEATKAWYDPFMEFFF